MKLHTLIALVVPFVCRGTEIVWQFGGGSLERAERPAHDHFRVFVKGQTDQDDRNRQASWYYFRVDAAEGKTLTIDILGLPGEYNYQPNRGAITKDTPPVISYDHKTWRHVTDFEYDEKEPRLRIRIHPLRRRFWIAHTPPYTLRDLASLRQVVLSHPDVREEKIGQSVQGHDLLLWTIGKPDAKATVWLMFRQHAWESGSSWTGDGAVRALLHDIKLRSAIRWKILPMADPDGVEHGGVRFNLKGYDLNRNWDVYDDHRMPEIAAQRKAILDWLHAGNSIDLFFTLHNTETAEYLEGPPGPLAQAFFKALKEQTTFDPTRPLSAVVPNTQPGRANVVQALGCPKDSGLSDGAADRLQRKAGPSRRDSRPHQLRPRARAGHLHGRGPSPDETITVISIGYSTISGQWATSKAIIEVSSKPSATESWGLPPPP